MLEWIRKQQTIDEKLNERINNFHERAPRIVYKDFQGLYKLPYLKFFDISLTNNKKAKFSLTLSLNLWFKKTFFKNNILHKGQYRKKETKSYSFLLKLLIASLKIVWTLTSLLRKHVKSLIFFFCKTQAKGEY